MNRSILNIKDFTSGALWRRPEQLRGLVKNHTDVISNSHYFQEDGALLFSSGISLHTSETALAVGLSPISGHSTVGLISLDPMDPNLRSCGTARWLSMPEGFQVSSLSWSGDTLFIGSSRGRVLLSALDEGSLQKGSGPLHVSRALSTSSTDITVGELSSSPGAYASSAMVRSVSANRIQSSSVAAVCGPNAYCWDVNRDSPAPVCQWEAPSSGQRGSEDEEVPLLFTIWAPSSMNVLLSGSYQGLLSFVDKRAELHGSLKCPAATLHMPQGGTPVSADFNPLLPYVFSVASSDGTFSIFDIRYCKDAVHQSPSLQGALTSVRWLGLHSDLLCTGGVDGTVAIWNLRCPPTFCVGRAQFGFPIQGLSATTTCVKESLFGVTLSGEVTQTALNADAMIGLSVSLHSDRSQNSPLDTETLQIHEKEYEACRLLYTRQVSQAFSVLADCAESRFSRKETDEALHLVELADLFCPEDISYEDLVVSGVAEHNLHPSVAQGALNLDLIRSSRQLSSTLEMKKIRGITASDPADVRRLTSIRLNAMLFQLLESSRLADISAGVPRALQLLIANPELFNHIDTETVCGTVSFVLQADVEEGERFVRLVLQLLTEADADGKATDLIRRILETAQKPLITSGILTKQSRRFEEKFYRHLETAKEAVLTQLRILALGVDRYHEVIEFADRYQANCVENHQPGMFGWLSIKALLVYLSCLTADSNYVTFLWTSVQFIETFSAFPGVRQIETTLFAVVDRIYASGKKIITRLEFYSALQSFDVSHFKGIQALLKSCHNYISSILRVQLECENVAIESQMRELPAVMEKTLDVLNSSTEELLNAWAELIDVLINCPQQKLTRSYCLPLVQEFSFNIEDLVEISSKKANDDCLNEILETCDEFLDTFSPSAGKESKDQAQ